jgi:hypothetical protein
MCRKPSARVIDDVTVRRTSGISASLRTEGPEFLGAELTTMGVLEGFGAGVGAGRIGGIVLVTTSLTGVGVGSIAWLKPAETAPTSTSEAHKNFVVIFFDCLQQGENCGSGKISRIYKDSPILCKVVNTKTIYYINHKDILCEFAFLARVVLPYRLIFIRI